MCECECVKVMGKMKVTSGVGRFDVLSFKDAWSSLNPPLFVLGNDDSSLVNAIQHTLAYSAFT